MVTGVKIIQGADIYFTYDNTESSVSVWNADVRNVCLKCLHNSRRNLENFALYLLCLFSYFK